MSSPDSGDWQTLQLLAEPTRRRIYLAVRAAAEPVTRDVVATAAGISRRLAAFHLDLLADGGLLVVDFARPPGRSGPGAGRPAKRYRDAGVELDLSVPARRYDIVARILARAVSKAGVGDARATANAVALDEGVRLGALRRPRGRMSARATLDAATTVLDELGYEAQRDEGSSVRLRNCPFRAAAVMAPDVICEVNDKLVAGLLTGLGGHRSVTAALNGVPPDCCVTVARR
jgi:predicted ArsR family transcriptional regulator